MRPGTLIAFIVLAIVLFATMGRTPAGARLCFVILAIAAGTMWAANWIRNRPVPVRTEPRRRAEVPPDPYVEEVAALSLDEARRRAQRIIEERYESEPADPRAEPPRLLSDLAPSIREIIGDKASVRARFGDERFVRDEIKPFALPGNQTLGFGTEPASTPYLRIGSDADGNPLLVQPGLDTVYVLRKTQSTTVRYWLADYPSIYHWLLIRNPERD